MLHHRQADEGLDTRKEYAASLDFVFVVERDGHQCHVRVLVPYMGMPDSVRKFRQHTVCTSQLGCHLRAGAATEVRTASAPSNKYIVYDRALQSAPAGSLFTDAKSR